MLPVLYQELHRLASSYLSREAPGHTLRPPPWSTRPTSDW